MNFLRFYDSCIKDYRDEKFKNWAVVKNLYDMKMNEDITEEGLSISHIKRMHKYKQNNKISYFEFAKDDNRMFNALILKHRFCECFFIQSMAWAFGTLLKE